MTTSKKTLVRLSSSTQHNPPTNSTPNPSSIPSPKEDYKPVPIPNSNLTLFDPTRPVQPIFTNHESSEEEQRHQLDYIANMQLSGLYSLWSTPPKSPSAVLQLIRATTDLIRHRCKLYSVPYDSNDSTQSGRRLRTVSLD